MKKKTESEVYAYAISHDRVLVSKAFVEAAKKVYNSLKLARKPWEYISQLEFEERVDAEQEAIEAFDAAKKGEGK